MSTKGREARNMMINIRDLRIHRGWTQQQLADRAGATQPMISTWEGGTCQPSATNLYHLAKAFGVTMESLFTDNVPA
jgi:transcriptional regulator with XRE-family HTH domain